MDKNEALKIAQSFVNEVKGEFNLLKVILFGSYHNGNQTLDSDIDLAIIVNEFKDNYLISLSLLNKFSRKVNPIIEPVLFLNGKDPSGFLEHIEKNGEVIFSAS